jgi:hypothetical protein
MPDSVYTPSLKNRIFRVKIGTMNTTGILHQYTGENAAVIGR